MANREQPPMVPRPDHDINDRNDDDDDDATGDGEDDLGDGGAFDTPVTHRVPHPAFPPQVDVSGVALAKDIENT